MSRAELYGRLLSATYFQEEHVASFNMQGHVDTSRNVKLFITSKCNSNACNFKSMLQSHAPIHALFHAAVWFAVVMLVLE